MTDSMVLAYDGVRVASRRFREVQIDRRGKRLKPLQVSVGSNNPVKIRAVKDVFQALSLPARVRGVRVKTEVSDQPFDEEAVHGAMNRAKSAIGGGDFGVGIEAGLVWSSVLSDHFDVQYCAVVDRSGRIMVGHGPACAYSPRNCVKVHSGAIAG